MIFLIQVKDFQYNRSYAWGGTEIKVWFGKVEGLSVYFLEPQNGYFCFPAALLKSLVQYVVYLI